MGRSLFLQGSLILYVFHKIWTRRIYRHSRLER